MFITRLKEYLHRDCIDKQSLTQDKDTPKPSVDTNNEMEKFNLDEAPIVFQVAHKYGYGAVLMELFEKVYSQSNLPSHPTLIEALLAVCMCSCKNNYCVVMHARALIVDGFSVDDIQQLIEFHRLPENIDDRTVWENTLRKVAGIFRLPADAPAIYKSLYESHDKDVVHSIGDVLAYSLLLRFLIERYYDEVRIEQETILFSTVSCADELIHFFNENGKSIDYVYTICSICKDLESKKGWVPIERYINQLPKNTEFSHGVCERCTTRWLNY